MITTGDEVEVREYKRLTKLSYQDRALGNRPRLVHLSSTSLLLQSPSITSNRVIVSFASARVIFSTLRVNWRNEVTKWP